jgi:hypothetical protein
MDIEEKLLMSKILLGELDKMIMGLKPYDDEFDEIYSRALHLKMKMKMFYAQYEPPEMLEQLSLMDSIVKRIEDIHNKRGMY